MEEDEHDADHAEDTTDQDVEPAHGGAAREADHCHESIEDCLAKREVHKVEPDACPFAVALDCNYRHSEYVDVKGQTEACKRVEIISCEHSESCLEDENTGHD